MKVDLKDFLEWLHHEPDFNIHKDDIEEIIEDYKYYLKT